MNRPSPKFRGFTLVELLVVLAIIALLVVLAAPAFAPAKGTQVANSGHQIADALDLARQAAISQNRYTEVRFYKINGVFSAFRIEVYNDAFTTATPFSKLTYLPASIIMDTSDITDSLTDYSTLLSTTLNAAPATSPETLPGGVSAPYEMIQFRPDGATNLIWVTLPSGKTLPANSWIITVRASAAANVDTGGLPAKDYSTIQVNPTTGRVLLFHP